MLQEIDDFMVDIEERIEEMFHRILSLAPQGKIPLSDIDDGLSRLESIRVFILVLFLACRGKIQLWQEEELGDIWVSLPGGRG